MRARAGAPHGVAAAVRVPVINATLSASELRSAVSAVWGERHTAGLLSVESYRRRAVGFPAESINAANYQVLGSSSLARTAALFRAGAAGQVRLTRRTRRRHPSGLRTNSSSYWPVKTMRGRASVSA